MAALVAKSMVGSITSLGGDNGTWELSKRIDAKSARSLLKRWHEQGVKLGFEYLRSRGGVVQAGLATILRLHAKLLTLDTEGSRIVVMLHGAEFEFGNVGHLTSDLRAVHNMDGLSILLGNHDWLLLWEGDGQSDLALFGSVDKLLPAE